MPVSWNCPLSLSIKDVREDEVSALYLSSSPYLHLRCCFSAPNISRITNVPNERWISKDQYQPMNNMTPGMDFPVLYHDSNHERCLRTMKWGLIPSYTKINMMKLDYFKMFNARFDYISILLLYRDSSETVESKFTFRKLIQSNRCVVVLNGYYEWKLIQGKKQPYYVTTKSQNPIYVAAIYDIFESDSNMDPLYSFTILTCPANDSIRWLHERQPLILTESQVSEWIDNRVPPNASIVHRISELSQNHQDDEESTEELSSNTSHLSYVPEDIISYTVTPNMTSPTYQEDDSFAPYTPRLSRTITSFFQK